MCSLVHEACARHESFEHPTCHTRESVCARAIHVLRPSAADAASRMSEVSIWYEIACSACIVLYSRTDAGSTRSQSSTLRGTVPHKHDNPNLPPTAQNTACHAEGACTIGTRAEEILSRVRAARSRRVHERFEVLDGAFKLCCMYHITFYVYHRSIVVGPCKASTSSLPVCSLFPSSHQRAIRRVSNNCIAGVIAAWQVEKYGAL